MIDFTLRHFESFEDHRQCEALQRRVWVGDAEVPSNMTITLQRHGGLAMGAFDANGIMIACVLSMLAPAHQPGVLRGLCQHSHLAAVAPELQGRGVGEALKRAQAAAASARGFNLMTWTYDPLETRNARLNIAKLGCVCGEYIRNCYGEMRDAMNQGLPSDRFEVDWWLDRETRPSGEVVAAAGLLVFDPRKEDARIEVPADFQATKRNNLELAQAERLRTRAEFEQAFAAGYLVTGFSAFPQKAYYSLTKVG